MGTNQNLKLSIKGAKERIKKAEQGLECLTDLYIDNLVSKDKYIKKQNELNEELAQAKHDIKELQESLKKVDEVKELRDYKKGLESFFNAWNDNTVPSKEKNRLA